MKYLLSHTDRTLETHLNNCDDISKQLLENKLITAAFYDKELLETIRLHLVYFHDFGKATDFFQHRIIKAAESEKKNEKAKTLLKEHVEFIEWFAIHKRINAEKALKEQYELGFHSALGAYFQFGNFSNENLYR